MPDAAASFQRVEVPTASGRQTYRLWIGRCMLCNWETDPATGQDAAMAVIQHNLTNHSIPLPGDGGARMHHAG